MKCSVVPLCAHPGKKKQILGGALLKVPNEELAKGARHSRIEVLYHLVNNLGSPFVASSLTIDLELGINLSQR